MSGDIRLCAYGCGLAGLVLARWLGAVVPLWVAAAFGARWAPSYAGMSFVAVAVFTFAIGAWRLRPRRDRPAP